MNEYTVEKTYIEHLQPLGYEYVDLHNYNDVVSNFRVQVCRLNAQKLTAAKGIAVFSDTEFKRLLRQVENFDVVTAALHWNSKNRIQLELDNGEVVFLQLSSPNVKRNIYQVAHQIRMEKYASPAVKNNNRYDVTLLINGLPILQTEL